MLYWRFSLGKYGNKSSFKLNKFKLNSKKIFLGLDKKTKKKFLWKIHGKYRILKKKCLKAAFVLYGNFNGFPSNLCFCGLFVNVLC